MHKELSKSEALNIIRNIGRDRNGKTKYELTVHESRALKTLVDVLYDSMISDMTDEEINKINDVDDFYSRRTFYKIKYKRIGEWIDEGGDWYSCSECNSLTSMNTIYDYDFCPHCGAKMINEEKTEIEND